MSLLLSRKHSRVPVYLERPENIIGLILVTYSNIKYYKSHILVKVELLTEELHFSPWFR